ncbi:MAG: DNA gyrase inhibitor YacG [Dissulfurimicrobium sp.]|uniref:DNA gyrase inhibitor YacG n=1 Tax=Dissulfurimicrobium hydrothermale TaxID=1750598 RepID=UPI003C725CED
MNETEDTYNCPICGRPVRYEDNPFRPFCSRRCKMIDLGAWLKGDYYIPGADGEGDTDQYEDRDTDDLVKRRPL